MIKARPLKAEIQSCLDLGGSPYHMRYSSHSLRKTWLIEAFRQVKNYLKSTSTDRLRSLTHLSSRFKMQWMLRWRGQSKRWIYTWTRSSTRTLDSRWDRAKKLQSHRGLKPCRASICEHSRGPQAQQPVSYLMRSASTIFYSSRPFMMRLI